jgi:uncharacterized protein YjaG (DUF416 family)
MERPFNRDEVLRSLRQLQVSGALAFALSCAERMLPNYSVFSRTEHWGSVQSLRDALDAGWDVLVGQQVSAQLLTRLEKECQEATPDTENFDSIYLSPALDAACAAGQVLEFVRTQELSLVADLASLSCDTVDMYVQELEGMDAQDPRLEQRILTHPMMQAELSRQRSDLARLQTIDWSHDRGILLRSEWRAPWKSGIGLGG